MKTIFRKSFSLLITLVLGMSLFFCGVVLFFMNTLYYETNTRSLEHSARAILNLTAQELINFFLVDESVNKSINEPIENSHDEIFGIHWNEILQDTPYRITLINPRGEVLFDSQDEEKNFEDHSYRLEVETALSGKNISVTRVSESFGERQLYTAFPVYSQTKDRVIGVFRLSLRIPSFWIRVMPGALPFLVTAFLLAFVATALVYIFSRRLSLPISRLADIAAAKQDHADVKKFPDPAISDIQEFHELDTALHSMMAELRRLETVRKDFVANVSHELRTPIQLVKGFSENLLESDSSDPEQSRRFLEIIHRNARRMEDLTGDLLLLMNLESEDNLELAMEETPLEELLQEAAKVVQSSAAKKGIAITISCEESLTAHVNSSFLFQAILNLLENGIKYSPENTMIHLGAEKQNQKIIIEVVDQGVGISAEHLERIFERFYRVDRSRSRDAGGTGLGLSIVRHIALLHGGTAEVESCVGKGSVFRICLPE